MTRMGRVLRGVVALAVALTAWLAAAPARAASPATSGPVAPAAHRVSKTAPQCDPRGATTFAPTPRLDTVLTSIDVGAADEGCTTAFDHDAYHQGRGPTFDAGSPAPDGMLTRATVVVAVAPSGRAAPAHPRDHAPSGVRNTLERPPRPAR